jgi:hypothetical protein
MTGALVLADKITLTFQHPTDSSQLLTAAVTRSATPAYLISQMVQAGFLQQPERAGQYKLRDTRSNVQLLDNVTLESAGIADNATLLVDHATTGA